jgi:RNA polymerase sigma-70 factor (ECF subfamily)
MPADSKIDRGEEAELLARARGGDTAAFGRLVRLHQRRVYACALHVLADAAEAEDAVQETFLRAHRALAKFDGRAELSTWLYRICMNVSLNILRKRRRAATTDLADPRLPEPVADPSQGDTDPRRATDAARLYAKLAAAIDTLSPSLRTTLILVCIEGVSQKDAAEALGCPEGTIAWRIHEARARLLGVLGEELSAEIAEVAAASRRRPT